MGKRLSQSLQRHNQYSQKHRRWRALHHQFKVRQSKFSSFLKTYNTTFTFTHMVLKLVLCPLKLSMVITFTFYRQIQARSKVYLTCYIELVTWYVHKNHVFSFSLPQFLLIAFDHVSLRHGTIIPTWNYNSSMLKAIYLFYVTNKEQCLSIVCFAYKANVCDCRKLFQLFLQVVAGVGRGMQ